MACQLAEKIDTGGCVANRRNCTEVVYFIFHQYYAIVS